MGGPGLVQEETRTAPALGGQRGGPQRGLDEVAAHAHPLRVPRGWDVLVRDARCHLDADAVDRGGPAEGQREGRGPLLRVRDARRPARGSRASSGIREDRVDALGSQLVHVEVGDVPQAHLGPLEGPQVRGNRSGGVRVDIDRQNVHAQAGDRHGIRPDAAAQVRDAARTAVPESLGMPGGHDEARGLLEAVAREHHVRGEGAELGASRLAQGQLGEDCDHELRVEAGGAQGGSELGQWDGVGGLLRLQGLQQLPAGGGQNGGQGAHPLIVPSLQGRGRAGPAVGAGGGVSPRVNAPGTQLARVPGPRLHSWRKRGNTRDRSCT